MYPCFAALSGNSGIFLSLGYLRCFGGLPDGMCLRGLCAIGRVCIRGGFLRAARALAGILRRMHGICPLAVPFRRMHSVRISFLSTSGGRDSLLWGRILIGALAKGAGSRGIPFIRHLSRSRSVVPIGSVSITDSIRPAMSRAIMSRFIHIIKVFIIALVKSL